MEDDQVTLIAEALHATWTYSQIKQRGQGELKVARAREVDRSDEI